MSTPLNIVTLSGKTAGASANGGAAAPQAAPEAGFEDLLAVLLDLLAAKTAGSTSGTDTGAQSQVASAAQTAQSATTSLDLGGLLDLKALLASLVAKMDNSDEAAKTGDATAADASADDNAKTPDPLAAILDVLIGALQAASDARPNGEALTLDARSGDALKTLNALLASLTAGNGAGAGKDGTANTAPAPLSSDVIDKLKMLDKLLGNAPTDPQLANLKSRVSELLGAAPATDAAKSTAGNQRDGMVHVLDGAKANLHPTQSKADGGSGDTTGQNTSQQQSGQNQGQARQAPAGAGIGAQAMADAKGAGKSADKGADPVASLPTQTVDRPQQAQMRVIPSAYTQTANRIDVPQIAFEIARHATDGVNRFQIRLDPPEMGRIDVRLDLDRSGGLRAHLTVDRPETLDMLQRDARGLERALAQSGLDSSKTNLEFSLRQNPFARQDFNQGQRDDAQAWMNEADEAEAAAAAPPPVTLYRGAVRPGGVNMVA